MLANWLASPATAAPSAATILARWECRWWLRREGLLVSGGAPAAQPDGGGDEHHGQREQPAGFDPLEGPEPAAGLIALPVDVAVGGEALSGRRVHGRAQVLERADQPRGPGRERIVAAFGEPLIHDP